MITTQINHKELRPNSYERTEGISLTVPNQSLTIREILSRSGVLDIGQSVYYDDDPTHEGLLPTDSRDFDLSDVSEIANAISERSRRRQAEAKAQSEVANDAGTKEVADESTPKPKAKAADVEE